MATYQEQEFDDIQPAGSSLVEESAITYQRESIMPKTTRMIKREELETECFCLEDSKKRIIEKIHSHFHSQL